MIAETIVQESLKQQIPNVQPGDTVRVHQKIKEGSKERVQVFEGVVLARKHGKGINATITVRKVSQNVPVERIFPIHAPFIQKIDIVKRAKVRRAKLYYLRDAKGKKARLKAKEFGVEVAEPPQSEQSSPAGQTEAPKAEVEAETPVEETEQKKEV